MGALCVARLSSVPFMTEHSLCKGGCVDLRCKCSPPYALRSLGSQRAGATVMMRGTEAQSQTWVSALPLPLLEFWKPPSDFSRNKTERDCCSFFELKLYNPYTLNVQIYCFNYRQWYSPKVRRDNGSPKVNLLRKEPRKNKTRKHQIQDLIHGHPMFVWFK